MLDSVDVGVAINLGLCSGRTVGRTAVYFIRKLLRVGCRLRGSGKGWSLRLRGERGKGWSLRLRGERGKGWSLRLRGEGAKAGAFGYSGSGQRLEASLTRGGAKAG